MANPIDRLTPRELEITEKIAQGLKSSEISGDLGIGVETVKRHLVHIFDKVGCDNRTALARTFMAEEIEKARGEASKFRTLYQQLLDSMRVK